MGISIDILPTLRLSDLGLSETAASSLYIKARAGAKFYSSFHACAALWSTASLTSSPSPSLGQLTTKPLELEDLNYDKEEWMLVIRNYPTAPRYHAPTN